MATAKRPPRATAETTIAADPLVCRQHWVQPITATWLDDQPPGVIDWLVAQANAPQPRIMEAIEALHAEMIALRADFLVLRAYVAEGTALPHDWQHRQYSVLRDQEQNVLTAQKDLLDALVRDAAGVHRFGRRPEREES